MTSVLVIDDELLVRKTLRLTLEAEGFSVFEAEDGEVGVAQFAAKQPEIVLVDIVMPKKDGIETILELRKSPSKALIVAMSGGGRVSPVSLLTTAQRIGADEIVEKPFRGDDVVKLIKGRLQDRSPNLC